MAVTHLRGSFYVVIAIIAGLGYSLITVLTRKRPVETSRSAVPPDPGA